MDRQHFDTIAETLVDAIIADTNQIETLTRRGHRANAMMIAHFTDQRFSRLDALRHLEEQTGFKLTAEETERLQIHGTPMDRATLKALREGVR